MYELTVFVLTATRENRSLRVLLDSVSFSRIMLFRVTRNDESIHHVFIFVNTFFCAFLSYPFISASKMRTFILFNIKFIRLYCEHDVHILSIFSPIFRILSDI